MSQKLIKHARASSDTRTLIYACFLNSESIVNVLIASLHEHCRRLMDWRRCSWDWESIVTLTTTTQTTYWSRL